ncbi:MAG TPA: hypothetical protein VFT16_03600 [Candidatus Saccharimonadales bacterium]|nr:hypothetical protein [Candidatus Saccharimonadales bacterium]
MAISLAAYSAAIGRIAPQALKLDDSYYCAEVIIDMEARDEDVELVRSELPATLASLTEGPPEQFSCEVYTDWGYRQLYIKRRLLPGVYREGRRFYIEERLDRRTYEVIERLFYPKYEGAVRAVMDIRPSRDHHLLLKLVRWCGRWRVCLHELGVHFPELSHEMIDPSNELRFCVDDSTSNEQIWKTFERVAAQFNLYLSKHVLLSDPYHDVPSDTLAHVSRRGDYRWAVEHAARYFPVGNRKPDPRDY